ncbi:MAG: hypothetical protein CME61_05935 [Halobacteriovoraceae bacterium]|nr:hypothetical protein [Halobacteriovoraceae bacterium]
MIFVILALTAFLISHRIRFYTYLFIKNAELLLTTNPKYKIKTNLHFDVYSSNKLKTDFIFYRKKNEASFVVKGAFLKNLKFQEHAFQKAAGVKKLKYYLYSVYNHTLDLVFLGNYLALKLVLGKEKLFFLFLLFSELRIKIKGNYKGKNFVIGIV